MRGTGSAEAALSAHPRAVLVGSVNTVNESHYWALELFFSPDAKLPVMGPSKRFGFLKLRLAKPRCIQVYASEKHCLFELNAYS